MTKALPKTMVTEKTKLFLKKHVSAGQKPTTTHHQITQKNIKRE
jgi:hypothetical protein